MDEKIRVGVVGGSFASIHIQGFQHCPLVEVRAICRRQRDLALRTARENQITNIYTDFDEMIQRADIDVVSLAVPNHLHYPMAMKAFDQGKHVICEKPLALNLEQATDMTRKAEGKQLLNWIVFNWRYVPAMIRMKELIEEGLLGSIYHVFFSWFTESRVDRESRYSWRFCKEEAGYGALGDTGVHGIDLIHWMLGDFKKVISHMGIYVDEHRTDAGIYRKTEVEDTCSFLAQLLNGAQVVFNVSSVASGDSMIHLEMHGSKGALVVLVSPRAGDYSGKLFVRNRGKPQQEINIPVRLTDDIKPLSKKDTPRALFFARFAQDSMKAFLDGEARLPRFRDGLKAQTVLEALTDSWIQKKWTNLSNYGTYPNSAQPVR